MFYSGLTFNVVTFFYALLILPETVTPEMMRAARHIHGLNSGTDGEPVRFREKWARRIRKVKFRLLAPLIMFGPKPRPGGGWDLNLMLLVIAQFTHLMSVVRTPFVVERGKQPMRFMRWVQGVVQVKFLYAQHTYAWSVKQVRVCVIRSLLASIGSFAFQARILHLSPLDAARIPPSSSSPQ